MHRRWGTGLTQYGTPARNAGTGRDRATSPNSDRPMVALPARHVERPHAVGADVAEVIGGLASRDGRFRRKLP
jgi:hypothetical protein